jgi:predicted transglutaminase-like cysteine proteinase
MFWKDLLGSIICRINAKPLLRLSLAVAGCVVVGAPAGALMVRAPIEARPGYIAAGAPALTPLGHTRFCFAHPDQCATARPVFRPARKDKLAGKLADLDEVNRRVNRAIRPKADEPGLFNDIWRIAPAAGDCDDYAVTKRDELLKRGWSARSLLLAQVQTRGGEAHLVLVARMRIGDFVLDNLSERVMPSSRTTHRWTAIQSVDNPKLWRKASVVDSQGL